MRAEGTVNVRVVREVEDKVTTRGMKEVMDALFT